MHLLVNLLASVALIAVACAYLAWRMRRDAKRLAEQMKAAATPADHEGAECD